MTTLVTEVAISTLPGEGYAFFHLSPELREDFTAWLAALDASVDHLVSVEYHVADEPVLRLTRYAHDEEGRRLVTKDAEGRAIPLTETAEILCTIAPPEWWWPVCPQCGGLGTLRLMRSTVRCRSCRLVRLVAA